VERPFFDPQPTLWVEPAVADTDGRRPGEPCCVAECWMGADYVVNDERGRVPLRRAVCGRHLALFTAPVEEAANAMI